MTEAPAASWLADQCGMLPRAAAGVVVSAGGAEAEPARWPQGAARNPALEALARAALQGTDALVRERGPSEGRVGSTCIAVAFASDGARGAVAVEFNDTKGAEAGPLVERLRLGVQWLSALSRREASRGRLRIALEALALLLDAPHLHGAATAVATDLATRLGCERVSIGLPRRGSTSLLAVSHSARFDPRSRFVERIEAAMNEACDQGVTVAHPALAGVPEAIALAHADLVAEPIDAVCTVPLRLSGGETGAIVFEWASGHGPDARGVRVCEDVAALLGPAIDLRRDAEASIFQRSLEALKSRSGREGARGRARGIAGGVVAFLLIALVVPATHRVGADATLEGRVQRAIVAGVEGYIAQVNARPGDVVRRGDTLGRLDERDLRVERRRWAGQREQLRKEHREALASHDRAKVNVLMARVAQAEARIELLDAQLARTHLVAPFDGVVVRGDLSQRLGSPVEKGAVLFEVAPLDGYRIILAVDERDISYVAQGQSGRLALAALPGRTLPLTVERVTPVADAAEGSNRFRVEARLDEPVDLLRPGMAGVAKLDVGRRSLLWIWSHRSVAWLRLQAWSWWL